MKFQEEKDQISIFNLKVLSFIKNKIISEGQTLKQVQSDVAIQLVKPA